MTGLPWLRRISAVASLDDAGRRSLYGYVRSSAHAVGRDEAAQALGMPRSTVSFHLDRMVRDGLLAVEFRKSSDRTGPGSGRPAKMYRVAVDEVSASVPQRRYDLAADLLAAAVEQSLSADVRVQDALREAAKRTGVRLGSADLHDSLGQLGYEPRADADGGTSLTSCPFHRLALEHRDLVCTMNGALLAGAATAAGLPADSVQADNRPGYCCARIVASGTAPGNVPGPAAEVGPQG
ncbi:helix-turn-helix transcriptional regulator [Paenarthrobacter sp. NCHU4564]|uniref:helix-turn-helix transcriptional regulator n=1 Tax=Paenarthrobacter sp. NCHU4564 TaxID=3451353 RepID=UPI003F9E5FE0